MENTESIVIAGRPACGKTVFLSVLALKYQQYLFPKNRAAAEFLVEAQKLQHSQWPAPTDPLQQKVMLWKLSVSDHQYMLIADDVAGESWETFVTENQDPDMAVANSRRRNSPAPSDTPQLQSCTELESIENQFKNASCICLLIDLQIDIDEGINNKQRLFVIAAMNYLQKIGRGKCPLALVVTKCKTYGNTNWENVLQDNYGAMLKHHWEGSWTIIRTDAVADTTSDENNNLLPTPNFSSVGMGLQEGEFLYYVDHLAQKTVKKREATEREAKEDNTACLGCFAVIGVVIILLILLINLIPKL